MGRNGNPLGTGANWENLGLDVGLGKLEGRNWLAQRHGVRFQLRAPLNAACLVLI